MTNHVGRAANVLCVAERLQEIQFTATSALAVAAQITNEFCEGRSREMVIEFVDEPRESAELTLDEAIKAAVEWQNNDDLIILPEVVTGLVNGAITLLTAVRDVRADHRAKAKRCNFDDCGCEVCLPLDTALVKAGAANTSEV